MISQVYVKSPLTLSWMYATTRSICPSFSAGVSASATAVQDIRPNSTAASRLRPVKAGGSDQSASGRPAAERKAASDVCVSARRGSAASKRNR